MSPLGDYLEELDGALRMTGRARRRVLAECRDHLQDAAVVRGEAEAVACFGTPCELASQLDGELTAHRSRGATRATVLAAAMTAWAVLVIAHTGRSDASASPLFGTLFTVAAQVAAVAVLLAVLQGVRWRGAVAPAALLALLARRHRVGLIAAALTLFAAAGAVSGRSIVPLLALGALGVAGWAAERSGRLARRLAVGHDSVADSPFDDLAALCTSLPALQRPLAWVADRFDPTRYPGRCCATVALVASLAAFARDSGEGASPRAAMVTAAIEAGAVIAGFVALGPGLGLRRA